MSAPLVVEIGGRSLTLSNLDKVLYTEAGFTKSQVIDYYARIAPYMIPHLDQRCITLKRFPDGSHTQGFFEKRCPKHRPEWLGTHPGPGDRNGEIGYCAIDEPAALVWCANMAALELHAPMSWSSEIENPRQMVFDFDPGEPAAMRECCTVALLVREVLSSVGLEGFCKTSGSKGLQMYVPLNSPDATQEHAAGFALAVGQVLEKQQPKLVTTVMAKAVRPGKIFVDWSQNVRHKTTIAPYSLRARPFPTVSTPVAWDEVTAGASGDTDLRFTAPDVLARVEDLGDIFQPVLQLVQVLPPAR